MRIIQHSKKYNCDGDVVSGATLIALLKEARKAGSPIVFDNSVNINDLVWNTAIPFADRLDVLTKELNKCNSANINNRKLQFDIYHNFATDSTVFHTDNRKYHELELAIEVLKIVKRWYRKYNIDINKPIPRDVFKDFFKNVTDITPWRLNTLGINLYQEDVWSGKTMIKWANKLAKLGIITEEKLNSFLELLEQNYKKI